MSSPDEPVEATAEHEAVIDPDEADDRDRDEEEAEDDEDDEDEGDGEVDQDEDVEQSDFGPPFEARSFGGEFVWADSDSYTCKILRVRAGEKVLISTKGRRNMIVMLTGGRAVLEVVEGESVDRVELLPASPIQVVHEREHRLVALTEVELFTVYSPEAR